MMFDNDLDEGLALDLTPFVNVANASADTYAKVKAANASAAAIKNASRLPQQQQQQQAAPRQRSMLSYLLLAAAVGGVGYFGLKAMGVIGKRRR